MGYRKRYYVTIFHPGCSLSSSWVIRDKKKNKYNPKGEIVRSFTNEQSAKLECEKMNKVEV